MGNLLDSILGSFNSGESDGFLPVSMPTGAPSNTSPDQISTQDPYGNPVGGPAPNVPLPRPRPPQAGPAMFTPSVDTGGGEGGGDGGGDPGPALNIGNGGGLAAAATGIFNPSPDLARRVSASLGGGLSKVGSSPFAGQAFANAAGGALEAGNQSDDALRKQKLADLGRELNLLHTRHPAGYRTRLIDAQFCPPAL